MGRTAKTIGFSVPPELKREVEQLAKKGGMTKSELFREMVRIYKQAQFERDFFVLQKRLASKARERGIYTEEDVERIINEGR